MKITPAAVIVLIKLGVVASLLQWWGIGLTLAIAGTAIAAWKLAYVCVHRKPG